MTTRGTPHRTIRIEDGLWEAAKEAADERGDKLSGIIRAALWRYIENHTKEQQ